MDTKRIRHTPEQIVRRLREADRLVAENILLTEVMRHLEISHQTYQQWQSQYGAMRLMMWRGLKPWIWKTPS